MRNILSYLSVLFVGLFLAAVSWNPAIAADFDYSINTNYELRENDKTTVRSIISITNNVTAPSPSSLVIPAAGAAEAITASYQDAGEIKANYNPDNQTIRLETTKDFSGQNRKWSVVINYEADLSVEFGDSRIMSVKPLDYGGLNVTSESVSIAADTKLGVAIARGPEPDLSKISAGKQILTWQNDKGPLQSSVGLLFGDGAVADVRIETKLKNDTWWWQTQTVTLPPDTNQQQVFLEEISPTPSNIRLDIDGNILAEYSLRPQQSITVSARANIAVSNFSYSLSSKLAVSDTPTQIQNNYTATFGPWSGEAIDLSIDAKKSAVKQIELIFEAATDLDYSQQTDFVKSRSYSDALIGELRANNIPARLVLGHVFGNGGSVFEKSVPHAWVEAYAAGVGWITLDVVFDLDADYFGTTDVQRVGLVLRGIESDFPPQQLENTTVTYTENDTPEIPEMVPQISANKYVFLPGIAVESISIQLPSGVIVDGTAISVDGEPAKVLGSLAPLQNAQLRKFSFGTEAFTGGEVNFGLLDGEQISPSIETANISVNYLPLIVISVTATLGLVGRWVWRRRHPKKEKIKRSKDAVVFATEKSGESIEHADLIPDTVEVEPSTKTTQPGDDTISSNSRNRNHRRPRRRLRREKLQ